MMIPLPDNFSRMGLGTSRLASLGSRLSVQQAKDLFAQALQMGVRVIDTSDTYGSGDAERLVAGAIAGHRQDHFIITKAGFPYMALPAVMSPVNQVGKKVYGAMKLQKNFSKNYLLKSLSKSLARLRTDAVDLFLLHEPSEAELLKYPDFYEGLQAIKQRGMAKYTGISTDDPGAYQLAFEKNVVDFVQTALPYDGEDDSVLHRAKAAGIPVIANQVMRILPSLSSDEKFMKSLQSHGLQQSEIPTVIMNYACRYKMVDCVLTGTRNIGHLRQNNDSLNFEKNIDDLFQLIAKKKI